uniref:RING-type domain-containing protein n=1 Tax=Schizophyllum commune (strain H4-8 / FGSC 9210) TaxID=578458 RepID=D8QLZ9_SCHCM
MPLLYHPSSFCDICYDTYSDTVEPYVIGCGHVFCKTCLESIPNQAPARGTVISNPVCPTCRKTYWSNKIRRLYVDLYTGENQPEEQLAREQALDELELLDKLLHHWDEDEDELPQDIVAEIEAWLQVRSGENTPVVQRLTSLLRKYKKVRKRSKQDRHEARRLRDRLERHDTRHQQEAEMATGVERSLQEQIIELRCKVTEYETQVYSLQIALAERQQGPPPPPPVPTRPNEPALTRSNTEPALPQPGLTRTLSNPASRFHARGPPGIPSWRAWLSNESDLGSGSAADAGKYPCRADARRLPYQPDACWLSCKPDSRLPSDPTSGWLPTEFPRSLSIEPSGFFSTEPPGPLSTDSALRCLPSSTRSGQTPGSIRSGQTARSSTPPDGIIPGASPTSRVHPSKGLGGAARCLTQDASPPRSHGESSNRAHAEASTRAPTEGSHRAPAEGSHRPAESSNRPPGTSHLVPESSHRSRRHRTTRSETAATVPQQQPATMAPQQAAATIPHQPTPSYAWDPAALNDAAAALASSATVAGHAPTGSTLATGHVPNAPTQAGPNYAPPPTTHPTAPSGPRIYPPPMAVSTSQRQFDPNDFLLPAAMQGGPNGQSFTNGHARTESYPDGYMPSDAYMNAYLTSYDQAYVEGYQRHADRIANVAGGGDREHRRRRHRRSEPEAPTRAREVYAQSQQAPSTSTHSTDSAARTPTATSMTLSSSSGSTETAHPALRRSGTTGHDSLAASGSRRALTAAERDARRRAAFSQTDEERQRRERREQRESITSSLTSSAPSWTGTQVSVPESQASVGQFRLANFPTSPPELTGEVPTVSPHIPPALLFVPPTAASPGSPPLELLNSPTGSPADLAVPGAPRQGPRALSVSTGASNTPRVWSAQSYGSRGSGASRGSGLSNLLGLTEMETVSSAAPLSMPTPRQPAPAFLRALSETYSG